jgi:hypothetical protein
MKKKERTLIISNGNRDSRNVLASAYCSLRDVAWNERKNGR